MDPRVARLFELPLDEFTAARNELAAELRAGDPALAKDVKALAKPSAPAWAVNQLARREPALLEALTDAGDRLRKAQQRVLQGEGPASLREAQQTERAALAPAVARAETILAEAGYAPSAARTERIQDTLHAMALDPDVREEIREGRLVREISYAGIGAEGDLAEVVAMPSRATAPPAADEDRERRIEAAREEARRAEEKAREEAERAERLRKEADRAAQDAEDARAAALEARKASTRARREAEAATEALRRLERGR